MVSERACACPIEVVVLLGLVEPAVLNVHLEQLGTDLEDHRVVLAKVLSEVELAVLEGLSSEFLLEDLMVPRPIRIIILTHKDTQ